MNQQIPPPKKILVIGRGGRENSLAWALCQCKGTEMVLVAPGNAGTKNHLGCIPIDIKEDNTKGLIKVCLDKKIELVVIGPEAPLAEGLADMLREKGLNVFGPGANGAQLEASKKWSKDLMVEADIPTAKYWSATTEEKALLVLKELQRPLVVKADGLASGKGVTVSETISETEKAIREAFSGKFGESGKQLILEEKLEGPEVSIFALCDGEEMVLLPPAQDHKRLKEGDLGPNTGGMGAYAPAPLLSEEELKVVEKSVLEPTLHALKSRGIDYRGVIYAGLMLTSSGPKVIEFNCRFGDPECQALMPLMGPELSQVLYACARGCLKNSPKLSISNKCSACIVAAAYGYPDSPRSGDFINIDMHEEESLQLFHAGTQCDEENKIYTSGGRVLSIVAQGKNFDDAFNNAYKGIKNIFFDGMQYRKDIGKQVRTN